MMMMMMMIIIIMIIIYIYNIDNDNINNKSQLFFDFKLQEKAKRNRVSRNGKSKVFTLEFIMCSAYLTQY